MADTPHTRFTESLTGAGVFQKIFDKPARLLFLLKPFLGAPGRSSTDIDGDNGVAQPGLAGYSAAPRMLSGGKIGSPARRFQRIHIYLLAETAMTGNDCRHTTEIGHRQNARCCNVRTSTRRQALPPELRPVNQAVRGHHRTTDAYFVTTS